jgi:hypothetical protein
MLVRAMMIQGLVQWQLTKPLRFQVASCATSASDGRCLPCRRSNLAPLHLSVPGLLYELDYGGTGSFAGGDPAVGFQILV